MRKLYSLLCVVCWAVLLQMGCGRKGPPIVPVVPQPLPVQNVSANIDDSAITLSWTPPSEYNNGKSLKLKDIKTVTVFRKTVTPADNTWDFSRTSEGWTVAGSSFPIKWLKGVLRTASKQKSAFIISPKDLSIKTESMWYIRLKLWSKNSDRGYIAFITKEDSNWDIDIEQTGHPSSKLKSFQIPPVHRKSQENIAHEHIIDMKEVPSWKGTINQVGVILRNSVPGHAIVELGLDSFEFASTLEERTSIYESSPWLFLEDGEGWRADRPDMVFGAAGGILYAQGSDSVVLMSAPGQNVKPNDIRQVQMRMKVTHGDKAYLVFRRTLDEQLQPFTSAVADILPYVLQFPLKGNSEFHTYTINLKESFANKGIWGRPGKEEVISQIGILFPALTGGPNRHILIDYIHLVEFAAEPGIFSPFLVQKDIPPIDEIEQQVRQKMSMNDPNFDVSYNDLPFKKEEADDESIKLVEISPKNPAPVVIKDGKFYLTDSGEFSVDTTRAATLSHGKQYTYTIELTDRKKQKSIQPGSITVMFTRIPTAPYNLKADPGDEEIRLMWNRPFLTVNGRKIKSFAGYDIFRSLEPGQYPSVPRYRASPYETTFTDKNLSNGTTYYYTVRSAAPMTSGVYVGDFSQEVSAVPVDTIPPEVPTGVVGVYIGDTVNVFWNLVQAKDFAGFNVCRSENPVGEFRQINSQPILQASYQDTTVEANKKYYYYATSFDDAVPPNESQPSEVTVVETFTFE